jgi:hypothetical protein
VINLADKTPSIIAIYQNDKRFFRQILDLQMSSIPSFTEGSRCPYTCEVASLDVFYRKVYIYNIKETIEDKMMLQKSIFFGNSKAKNLKDSLS